MHVMVLNDGETYSDISGCKIVWIDDTTPEDEIVDTLKDLDRATSMGDAEIISTFT